MSLEGHRRHERLSEFHLITSPGPDGRIAYRPLDALTKALKGLLVLDAVLAIAVVVVAVASVPHFDDAFNSVRLDGAATKWTTPIQGVLALALVATVGVFFGWLARSYKNLEPLGVAGLRRSTGFVTWCWFIPIANLVFPKEVIDDLWRASDPDSLVLSDEWKSQSVPFRNHVWWACSVIAVTTLIVTQWLIPAPGQINGSLSIGAAITVLVAYPMLALSSILLVLLVGDVTERQAQRAASLSPREVPSSVGVDEADGAADPDEEPASVLRHSADVSVSGRY